VCNGCSDNTAHLVRGLNNPRLRCIELAGFVDTDGASAGKDVARLLIRLDGSDWVIAKWKGVNFKEVNEALGRRVRARHKIREEQLLGRLLTPLGKAKGDAIEDS